MSAFVPILKCCLVQLVQFDIGVGDASTSSFVILDCFSYPVGLGWVGWLVGWLVTSLWVAWADLGLAIILPQPHDYPGYRRALLPQQAKVLLFLSVPTPFLWSNQRPLLITGSGAPGVLTL